MKVIEVIRLLASYDPNQEINASWYTVDDVMKMANRLGTTISLADANDIVSMEGRLTDDYIEECNLQFSQIIPILDYYFLNKTTTTMATKKKSFDKKFYIIIDWDFGNVLGDHLFDNLEDVNNYLKDILVDDYNDDVKNMEDVVFVYEVNPLKMTFVPASVEIAH